MSSGLFRIEAAAGSVTPVAAESVSMADNPTLANFVVPMLPVTIFYNLTLTNVSEQLSGLQLSELWPVAGPISLRIGSSCAFHLRG
ncbi:unnamed protein product [Nippostrongylus brasiliensis]|uniref:DUF11 domain-containing protein n=1 Tax=Nippostrongylus brasiliensis TaxID=27835 RepID=A0A0N4XCJ4_NIPBR|nr:unnamed protein product [Nippostrongylus brasiliensis]